MFNPHRIVRNMEAWTKFSKKLNKIKVNYIGE